jgi:hypothetical protein
MFQFIDLLRSHQNRENIIVAAFSFVSLTKTQMSSHLSHLMLSFYASDNNKYLLSVVSTNQTSFWSSRFRLVKVVTHIHRLQIEYKHNIIYVTSKWYIMVLGSMFGIQ